MTTAHAISSVGEACDFVQHWLGIKADLPGPAPALDFALPHAISTLNRRLGQLWAKGQMRWPNLFATQDTLLAPDGYERGAEGVVPFLWENQGVWGCGYKPNEPEQLWVTGDWPDERVGSCGWRRTSAAVDSAVIFLLLANMAWASPQSSMQEGPRPLQADQLLWSFTPWAGFDGFWTDRGRTLLHLAGPGMDLTFYR